MKSEEEVVKAFFEVGSKLSKKFKIFRTDKCPYIPAMMQFYLLRVGGTEIFPAFIELSQGKDIAGNIEIIQKQLFFAGMLCMRENPEIGDSFFELADSALIEKLEKKEVKQLEREVI